MLQKVLTEVECRRPALDLLQSSYTRLTTQSSLDSLTQESRNSITQWAGLQGRAEGLRSSLRAAEERWNNFKRNQGAALIALTSVDVELTQIDLLDNEHSDDLDTYKNKLKKLLVSSLSYLFMF